MLNSTKSALWNALGLGPEWVKRDKLAAVRKEENTVRASQAVRPQPANSSPAPRAVQEQRGGSFVPRPSRAPAPAARPRTAASVPGRAEASPQPSPVLPVPDISGKNWEEISALIRSCERCRLAKDRTLSVPGIQGKINEVVLIGEAPGRDEDLQGMPFVGASGKLLDKILTALKWKRGETVSILNTVKCRPPANRDPGPDEMGACACYLDRQVELLDPKLIVVMGRSAIERVFGQQLKVSSLRGKTHTVRIGCKTRSAVVTYHPSYLLRSPREKRKAWADWCLIATELERLDSQNAE